MKKLQRFILIEFTLFYEKVSSNGRKNMNRQLDETFQLKNNLI